MNLRSTIIKVLKEETKFPTYLRRRVSVELIDIEFNRALKDAEKTYIENYGKWNAMTSRKYKGMVISILMDTLIDDDESFEYDEIYDSLYQYYNDKMEESYQEITDQKK